MGVTGQYYVCMKCITAEKLENLTKAAHILKLLPMYTSRYTGNLNVMLVNFILNYLTICFEFLVNAMHLT